MTRRARAKAAPKEQIVEPLPDKPVVESDEIAPPDAPLSPAGVFVTGATGYLGGYALVELLQRTERPLYLLVRCRDDAEALHKLWRGLQLHLTADAFAEILPRLTICAGDLHAPGLGLSAATRATVLANCDTVLHIAASLNRKSEKACLNSNLRGTLSVIRLAKDLLERGQHGLRRYAHVSTVAVCGHRNREVVTEDGSVDWDRSDYDPYGRTKKFAEHMARELLPADRILIMRPSIVMGDSRRPETSQFDMVRAFCVMADLPVLPLNPATRLDIVPANWVGKAIAHLTLADQLNYDCYHLSSGVGSCVTAAEIGEHLGVSLNKPMRFAAPLAKPFDLLMRGLNRWPRRGLAQQVGALMKVFWPYIEYDTVFDNQRAVTALGEAPAPFTLYAADLYAFSKGVDFQYPYLDYPADLLARAGEGA